MGKDMKLKPTKLSYYGFCKNKLEETLIKILKSPNLSEESKEKLRPKYEKKIKEYEFKIRKEMMRQT